MPTLTLRPNGAGAATQHSRNAGIANWARTSESSSDGDTSYCYKDSPLSGSITVIDSYALGNSGGQAGAISGVTLSVVAKYQFNTLTAQITPVCRIGGVYYSGTTSNLTSAYATYSKTWATSPATGVAWTWTEVNALEVGFQSTLDDDGISISESRITQVFAAVAYSDSFVPGVGTLSVVGVQPAFVMGPAASDPDTVALVANVGITQERDAYIGKTQARDGFICRAVSLTAER